MGNCCTSKPKQKTIKTFFQNQDKYKMENPDNQNSHENNNNTNINTQETNEIIIKKKKLKNQNNNSQKDEVNNQINLSQQQEEEQDEDDDDDNNEENKQTIIIKKKQKISQNKPFTNQNIINKQSQLKQNNHSYISESGSDQLKFISQKTSEQQQQCQFREILSTAQKKQSNKLSKQKNQNTEIEFKQQSLKQSNYHDDNQRANFSNFYNSDVNQSNYSQDQNDQYEEQQRKLESLMNNLKKNAQFESVQSYDIQNDQDINIIKRQMQSIQNQSQTSDNLENENPQQLNITQQRLSNQRAFNQYEILKGQKNIDQNLVNQQKNFERYYNKDQEITEVENENFTERENKQLSNFKKHYQNLEPYDEQQEIENQCIQEDDSEDSDGNDDLSQQKDRKKPKINDFLKNYDQNNQLQQSQNNDFLNNNNNQEQLFCESPQNPNFIYKNREKQNFNYSSKNKDIVQYEDSTEEDTGPQQNNPRFTFGQKYYRISLGSVHSKQPNKNKNIEFQKGQQYQSDYLYSNQSSQSGKNNKLKFNQKAFISEPETDASEPERDVNKNLNLQNFRSLQQSNFRQSVNNPIFQSIQQKIQQERQSLQQLRNSIEQFQILESQQNKFTGDQNNQDNNDNYDNMDFKLQPQQPISMTLDLTKFSNKNFNNNNDKNLNNVHSQIQQNHIQEQIEEEAESNQEYQEQFDLLKQIQDEVEKMKFKYSQMISDKDKNLIQKQVQYNQIQQISQNYREQHGSNLFESAQSYDINNFYNKNNSKNIDTQIINNNKNILDQYLNNNNIIHNTSYNQQTQNNNFVYETAQKNQVNNSNVSEFVI